MVATAEEAKCWVQAERTHYEDRVVVVTGGGMHPEAPVGTGAAIAHLFAAEGGKIAVVDASKERGERTLTSIREGGGEALFCESDVTQRHACQAAIARTLERWGRVDVLVNNVGISVPGSLDVVELETWDRVHRVNVTGALLMTQAAVGALAKEQGSIVNVSSIAAVRAFGDVAYASSKAALIALTRDTAFSLGRRGVRANCILPGHIYSPMGRADGERRQKRMRANLLGIEGTAWDVAAAARFLASSRWLTGMALPVDAGATVTTSLGLSNIPGEDG